MIVIDHFLFLQHPLFGFQGVFGDLLPFPGLTGKQTFIKRSRNSREFVKRVTVYLENIDLIGALGKEMDAFIRDWIKKHPDDWERIKANYTLMIF